MRIITKTWLAAIIWLPLINSVYAQSEEMIDEIVVTADFRERALSEVPASVTVLDSETINDGAVQHFEELITTIPNFNWSGDGHRARYFQIRGVGELEQYQGAPNPSVGLIIDEIDFSGIGTIATLFDMERIEVLRGPQGTRYGANALAGLIFMRSAAPTKEFQSRVQFTVGDDDTVAGGIAVGGSIDDSQSLTGRFSVHRHRSNGFRDNPGLDRDDTNGRDETTARARLRWVPNDTWQVDLAALFTDVNDGYDAFSLDNSFTMLSDKPGKDAQQSTGASIRAEFSGWNDLVLTSITSLADSDIEFSFDADWGNDDSWAPFTYDYVTQTERERATLSQEFRLVALNWLVGAYAMNLEEDFITVNRGEYYDPFWDWADSLDDTLASTYESTNVAAFGQFDHDIGNTTRVSAGVRIERRTADYADTTGLNQSPSDTMSGGELTLLHDHSDRVTSFLRLAKGYKAGGFNTGIVPTGLRHFAAEEMWSLESGLKFGLGGGDLQVNASVFAARYKNQQVRMSEQLIPGDPASFVIFTVNAGRGESLGLEADLRWMPNERWTMHASAGLLNADLETGRGQAHAPAYTLGAGATYHHPRGFIAGLDVHAKDEFYFDISHDQKSAACQLVHARLGYEADSWTVRLWARNLFDENYAVRGFYFGNEPPDFPNTIYTRAGDPRQAGVTFTMEF